MKTPEEKYMNDGEYRHLIDTLHHLIVGARFTPSELREAVIFASIKYEMEHIRSNNLYEMDPRVKDAFNTLDKWMHR